MSDIFISYAREDGGRVRRLADALSGYGWSVWWDREVPAGTTFDQEIAEALANAGCVMVVWSRDSVASSWVREEADEGRKRGVLIPVVIDDVSPPLGFGRIQAARMIGWDGAIESEEFQKLTADGARIVGPPPRLTPAPETVSPMTPADLSSEAQRVIPTPDIRAASRTSFHRRTVRLSLAVALVVAVFLAVIVYRRAHSGGDRADPPALRPPAQATALRLTAVLAEASALDRPRR